MLTVIRQFAIEPSQALRDMWPKRYYPAGFGHEVLAVQHDLDTDPNTKFLIVNSQGEFEWVSFDDCTLHKLHDRG